MKQRKVLIVDDDVRLTRLLKTTLGRNSAYDVVVENDSRRALETIRETKPDVVVLDVMMPNLDGGDVARVIRNDATMKDIPIIFLTALVSKKEQEARNVGSAGDRYLGKPIDAAELAEEIGAVLREKGG